MPDRRGAARRPAVCGALDRHVAAEHRAGSGRAVADAALLRGSLGATSKRAQGRPKDRNVLRILDRHVLGEFALYLSLGLATFVGIYLVVDLFEKIDTFVDHHASARLIFDYYLYSLPLILVQVLPVAMLLGAILSFGHLRKLNEITAMQSCGLSPLRITMAPLALAALLTAAAYGVGEVVVPEAYMRQQETLDVKIKRRRPQSSLGRSDIHYMGRGGRVYVAQQFQPQPPQMIDLSVQQFEARGGKRRMVRRADAARAAYGPHGWTLSDGFLRLFREDRELAIAFRRYRDSRHVEAPDEFARPESDPFHMSRADLRNYIERIREGGAAVRQYEVDYHLRAAFPLANLIMVLLGTCLSLRIKRGTTALGFGLSVSLGFAYYGFLRVGQALGYNGNVPPLLAAWLGNIVFGAGGGLLFWRVNR
ncbi:MAG: LptF/LptG family permease [Candidatus Eisenbacteria bacterium]|nr:LptF/LptG family permease [Candidatus Eisenbacteria bacterium]